MVGRLSRDSDVGIASSSSVSYTHLFDLSINKEMKDNFARATVYHKPKCQDCWAKFYCSGGCNANNWQYMGNVLDSFDLACEMEKKLSLIHI